MNLWQGGKDTLYRIHAPSSRGRPAATSPPAAPEDQQDVIDLYRRTEIGAGALPGGPPSGRKRGRDCGIRSGARS
jgi:hypothetical protein